MVPAIPYDDANESSTMPSESRPVEDLLRRLQGLLPPPPESVPGQADFKAALREALAALLARLDLVTREEFEVQRALLDRAVLHLEALEAELARTRGESRTGAQPGAPPE